MNTLLTIVVVPVSLVVVFAFLRVHHRSRLEAWRELLDPVGRDAAAELEEAAELDQLMADHAWQASQRSRDRLDLMEAVRLLELALRVIEDATPSRVQRLKSMGRLIRMSMAILPIEAVPPSRFRLRRVGAVARLGAWLDALVVAPSERMAVRLRVLMLGFGLTLHVLRISAREARATPAAGAPWDRFRAAMEDWYALDDEQLRSLRVLVAAIAVELKREEIAGA